MKIINVPDARSVRIAGIEIIDSVKSVASVFTEILLFMVWFPAIVYGLYRFVIVLWDASLKPQSLIEFINFMVELYSYVLPSLAVIAVALVVVLSIFKRLSAIWEEESNETFFNVLSFAVALLPATLCAAQIQGKLFAFSMEIPSKLKHYPRKLLCMKFRFESD